MSEESKSEQSAATENKDPAKQGSEDASGAQGVSDDYDKAFSEWDSAEAESSSQQPKPSPGAKAEGEGEDVKTLLSELKQEREERRQERFQSDLNKVVKELRGDFTPEEVDDDHIDIWLDKQARKDPRVATAWANRHRDPAKFERAVNALKSKFEKEHARFRRRDEEATADVAAVSHAVRGSSRSAPEGKAPDYSKMSDAEYREAVKKEHGFTPI